MKSPESYVHQEQEVLSSMQPASERRKSEITNRLLPALSKLQVNTSLKALLILVVFFSIGWFIFNQFYSSQVQIQLEKDQKQLFGELPKIMWIYTHGQLHAQHVNNLIYYYHLNHSASLIGYEVRVVNSWTAYKWIKNQTRIAQITFVIQNTRIDETVDSLLKLALLIENGGIMIGNLNTVINTNLTWLQLMFQHQHEQISTYSSCFNPEVYMIEYSDNIFGLKFYQDFIAALPNSLLLLEGLHILEKILLSGQFPDNHILRVLQHRQYTNIDLLPHSIENVISYLIWKKINLNSEDAICQSYGMTRISESFVLDLNDFPSKQRRHLMFNDQRPKNALIINTNTTSVNEALGQLIENSQNKSILNLKSAMKFVLEAPGNRQIFLEPFPERSNIHLCLVVIDELKTEEIKQIIQNVQNQQTQSQWTLVIFKQGKDLKNDGKILILESEGNEIRNIQIAVCKYCPKRSYSVLLHKGEKFNNNFALAKISQALQPPFILGGAINLDYKGKLLRASQEFLHFSRSIDGIVNPKIDIMEGILNHFRIFSVEAFRYIPQFDHVDMFGNYFKDRLIFLMTLLEMLNQPREGYKYTYIYLKYYQIFNIPKTAVLIDSSIYIKTTHYDRVDPDQLTKTRARFDAQPVQKTMEEILGFDIAFDKQIVFNPGNKFISVNDKKGPNLIPKVIHQAWLGSKLGIVQEYFLSKTKMVYPDYEIKLWQENNITRKKFPLTFQVIKNILDFNRKRGSTFNKLATVTDIIRHEVLFHQGGFWRDAGMNLLKPVFNYFLKYQFVVGAERSLRHRWNQGMCFFATAPNSIHLGRISSLPNVNRMRIYGDVALDIAGPFDFRNTVIGYQEYYPSILILHFQFFYPGQIGRPPFNDLCTRYEKEYNGEPFHFKAKQCYLLKDCQQKYPMAYGLDHNCFGVSWMKRKQ